MNTIKQSLLKKIKKEFPTITYKHATLVTRGWDKIIIILDKKIVFAFPRDKEAQGKTQRWMKIAPLLQNIQTIPIPQLLYVAKNNTFAGFSFLQGKPLTTKIFFSLTKQQQTNIAKQLGTFLKKLHHVSIAQAKKCGVTHDETDTHTRTKALFWTKRIIKHLSPIDATILKQLFTEPVATEKNIYPKEVFTHQDLTTDNIFFNSHKHKISGIIDFDDMQIADPASDIGRLWKYGESCIDTILSHYGNHTSQLKARSWRHYQYYCIENMYVGITKRKNDYFKRGYSIISSYKKQKPTLS